MGFPSSSVGKESTCNAGDINLIPGLGRSPGGGHGNPLSTLAWIISWTEEPDGLQSIQLQRVNITEVTEHAHMQLVHSRMSLSPHAMSRARQ